MRTFDLSPLFRSTVGFEHLSRMLDAASRLDEQAAAYPPYNIEKLGEDRYRITMAVAGFGDADLEVTAHDHTLIITGKAHRDEAEVQYLHRGIAGRPFERRFELADFIRVDGAALVNGLLHVDLVREVPEQMKPRTIAIETKRSPKVIEGKAA
ncbi:Hsp20 family protein [Magnetospirillum sp. UT-4]|uniref:Hsp20 family protein n=1 Tax=Magnetospirillum sp. UT-4 TaxID=2681467 RepID=UPI001383CBAF|nr:Hsp20 family protein [Magnetospirillum sp. UT-4]CAA7625581.1 heat shock chaperone [Magnetospirillum sp. UT-4]